MRLLRQAVTFVLLLLLVPLAHADEVLVLRDGRRIAVTRLARRDGQVVFQTAKGEVFSVPEVDVISPPLESIPMASPKGAEPLLLVLADGRKLPVTRLARSGGQVLFETTRGERFSVDESQVVAPPLDSIPRVEAPRPGAPEAPAPPVPAPPVAPPPKPLEAIEQLPVPPAVPAAATGPSGRYPLPDLKPLGFAGGSTIHAREMGNDEFIPMPDRWRLGVPRYDRYQPKQGMPFVEGSLLDPYNQNLMKGDFPIAGNQHFLNLNVQLNSNLNPREVAAPRVEDGVKTGDSKKQVFYNQNVVVGAEIFKGDTVFRPKDWALRATAVFNVNRLADNNSLSLGDLENKGDSFVNKSALEEAFVERRLGVLSPAYDFVSLRLGMQNFNSDFRGYVFQDNQLGARLFGDARGNRDQYNLAFFSMRRRDEVTQLHDFDKRNQNVFVANWFIQDFASGGYTLMFNVLVNDDSGVLADAAKGIAADPGKLRAIYLGIHGDGRWGGWNVSHAFYQVLGSDDVNRIAGRKVDINARMAALEISRDVDWWRYRASAFYASGDGDPSDDKAGGFDVITDNPNLAGGAFMFWTQQASKLSGLPNKGLLSDKFSLVPSLRSKFTNRSNFVNPGLLVLNGGIDARLSPKLKLVTNASYLRFAKAAVLQKLTAGSLLDEGIGIDLGLGFKYRPLLNENLTFVGGLSTLRARGGFAKAVDGASLFSTFLALQLAY